MHLPISAIPTYHTNYKNLLAEEYATTFAAIGKETLASPCCLLNKETGIQTLRFNIPPEDLPSTVSALQKIFRHNVVLTGDKKGQHAYIDSCHQAYRLKKKYGTDKRSVYKYANYWLWLNENISIEEKELIDFINPV